MSYDRHQPYYTSIKERYILNQPGSGKKTTHIVLDISFEQLPYRAGDAIGVLPRNSRMLVDKTLKAMGASGDEMVLDSKTDELLPLRQLFLCRRSIRKIKRKVFDLIVGEDLPSELQDRKSFEGLSPRAGIVGFN